MNQKGNSFAAQRRQILEALREGPLTTLEARERLGIMHPAARVMELRDAGFHIETLRQWEADTTGREHKQAQYVLLGEGGE